MKMMLPDVIGHENQSQYYQHHRCLCLDLSGQITTPDRFSYHTELIMLQMFQLKRPTLKVVILGAYLEIDIGKVRPRCQTAKKINNVQMCKCRVYE